MQTSIFSIAYMQQKFTIFINAADHAGTNRKLTMTEIW